MDFKENIIVHFLAQKSHHIPDSLVWNIGTSSVPLGLQTEVANHYLIHYKNHASQAKIAVTGVIHDLKSC